MTVAYQHGFSFATVNCPIHIADGLAGRRGSNVVVDKKHFKAVNIAAGIVDANAMIALSHFNGHDVAGFGGAIKNIAMGCASQAGKQQQHAVKTMVREENCEACGKCIPVCPTGALSRGENGKTQIDKEHCIGCFDCMNVCHTHGVDIDWEAEAGPFLERMAEYALGAMKGKEGKVGFMNFLINITPDCDCVPWSDAPIVPDIGIVASTDPVAIDAASFDLVNRQMGLAGSLLETNLGARRGQVQGTPLPDGRVRAAPVRRGDRPRDGGLRADRGLTPRQAFRPERYPRCMHRLSAILLAALALAFSAGCASLPPTVPVVHDAVYPASGLAIFQLENPNGYVIVTGWDQDQVQVRALNGRQVSNVSVAVAGDRMTVRTLSASSVGIGTQLGLRDPRSPRPSARRAHAPRTAGSRSTTTTARSTPGRRTAPSGSPAPGPSSGSPHRTAGSTRRSDRSTPTPW